MSGQAGRKRPRGRRPQPTLQILRTRCSSARRRSGTTHKKYATPPATPQASTFCTKQCRSRHDGRARPPPQTVSRARDRRSGDDSITALTLRLRTPRASLSSFWAHEEGCWLVDILNRDRRADSTGLDGLPASVALGSLALALRVGLALKKLFPIHFHCFRYFHPVGGELVASTHLTFASVLQRSPVRAVVSRLLNPPRLETQQCAECADGAGRGHVAGTRAPSKQRRRGGHGG